LLQLQSAEPLVALDLPGFGLSDKPKKVATHRLAWHTQVLAEFLVYLQPAPVAVHAPRSLAPLLNGLQIPIRWVEPQSLSSALSEAPYPDQGHRAGPRALHTVLGCK
jgi:tRNA(adenine34) deaminase